MIPHVRTRTAALGAAAALALAAGSASAQGTGASPTPAERREAGAAFDRGVAARASGDHAGAADLFETANRLAPSAQALGNAIREHRDVHSPTHDARAATLALRLLARYGGEPRFVAYANGVVAALAPTLDRVTVQCQGCDLEVDHELISDTEFFLEPGAHSIAAHWSGDRVRTEDLSAQAGHTDTVTLEPPAATATPAVTHAVETEHPTPLVHEEEHPSHPPPARGGWSPAVFITLGALTVASGVGLGISAAYMYSGVPAYMANPTVAGLHDGQSRELWTDVLIGTTAGLGGLALGSLIFTRWGGAASQHVESATPTVSTLSGGLAPGLTIAGRL